jgi:transcriptional regulator with XRE-family HTH domain
MNLKEEYNSLVKTVKNTVKERGGKITNEEMAERLNISRTYLSGLLGGSKEVTKKHIDDFKSHYRDELAGVIRPSEAGDAVNRERALIKVLLHRVAKLEAERLGMPVETVLAELEKDTMIAWRDLEKGKRV